MEKAFSIVFFVFKTVMSYKFTGEKRKNEYNRNLCAII